MAFTPKFVDLVRNTTTSTGTGPIQLGPIVDGYSGFAQCCAPGDQFYYCIQGLDRPSEREVGRGTMRPDGTIARDPVSGSLFNFKNGTKTIALVAAAEWFTERSKPSGEAALRSALATMDASDGRCVTLNEAGREGRFRFESGDHSALVAADSGQGLYVAPAAVPDGSAGAWVRMSDGAINPAWFGLREGSGKGAANSQAIAAMLTVLKLRAHNPGWLEQGIDPIRFPAGTFELADTIELFDGTFRIEGAGAGTRGGPVTKLVFAPGVTGIRVHRYNTSGATAVRTEGIGADGSVIRSLALVGGYSGTEAEAHGIQLRATATLKDLNIRGFEGDGIHVRATAGSGAPDEGNANTFQISRVSVGTCRRGIYVKGADGNAGQVSGCDFSGNRTWGVYDSSFLGNSYVACHNAANGWDGAIDSTPTGCTQNGKRYAVIPGQEAGASTNPPTGTSSDNAWWRYVADGGTYNGVVAWASGTLFRSGGAYFSDNANARNLFVGCYSESDQNPSVIQSPAMVVGGLHGAVVKGTGAVLSTTNGALTTSALRCVGDASAEGALTVGGALTASASFQAMAGVSSWGNFASNGNISSFGPSSGASRDHNVFFDNTAYYNTMIFRSWAAGVPQTDGEIWSWRGQGMILDGKGTLFLRANGTTIAQLNGAGFTLGTPTATIGYSLGAGGSVTQATSKATAVTLHRPAGKIVTTADALAGGSAVAFTLSNSQIAASDVVSVSVASGATAGAYSVAVDAVGAGSCRISLRNLGAGGLSEAVGINFAVIKGATA